LDKKVENNEIARLKIQLQVANDKLIEYAKTNNQVLKESQALKETTQNAALKEKELITQLETWQKVVNEMAHSINTDVYVAVANLDKHKDLPRIKKASYHVKQIRDLTNLLMWYIKRAELTISGELAPVNILELIITQIETIKDGISTLRLSSDEHQENILKMEIPIDSEGDLTVSITKEISNAIILILKDILRNALKNTNDEHPAVKMKLTGSETSVIIEIQNNQAISNEFVAGFNNETTVEPEKISQSARVGLRVIKMWIDLLKINAKFHPDYERNLTTARIIFPKEIRYENN